jgi:hypothetical protein
MKRPHFYGGGSEVNGTYRLSIDVWFPDEDTPRSFTGDRSADWDAALASLFANAHEATQDKQTLKRSA